MRLFVPGEPKGKARARITRQGHAYTPTPTLRAEQRIADAWRAAGSPRLADLPLDLEVTLIAERPANHRRVDGTLGKVGARSPVPLRKPDIDNALKLVMDALNGLAYRDDVQVVDARVRRRWALPDEQAGTEIIVAAADALLGECA